MRLAIAVVPLLAACAHAGKLAPLPAPDGPHGIVSIETRPRGARVVMERDGTRYLACRETPCTFEASPGQGRIDMSRFGYRYGLDVSVSAGEEERYAVELQGGLPKPGFQAFWTGVLSLIMVPATIMAIHERDAGWAVMFGVPASASVFIVFAPLVWPRRHGAILSQERRRIDAPEHRGEARDPDREFRPSAERPRPER
jgi:hypothetical protein